MAREKGEAVILQEDVILEADINVLLSDEASSREIKERIRNSKPPFVSATGELTGARAFWELTPVLGESEISLHNRSFFVSFFPLLHFCYFILSY